MASPFVRKVWFYFGHRHPRQSDVPAQGAVGLAGAAPCRKPATFPSLNGASRRFTDLGQKVLLVDVDVQPTLSSYYPLERRAAQGLSTLITEAVVEDVVSHTTIPSLDLILSDDPEGMLQNWILHTPDGRVRLKHLLTRFDQSYDFILLDTQGTVGPLQDSAVLAADLLVSPIPPEILSAREFARGTVHMLDRLRPMAYLGAPLGPLRGLIYRMDRTVDARRIAQELCCESYGPSKGAITILDTVIPNTIAYREAATARAPVHRWEPQRQGPTPSARDSMLALVYELFPHLTGKTLVGNGLPSREGVS